MLANAFGWGSDALMFGARLSENPIKGNPESKCSEGTSNVGGEFQSHLLLLLRFEFRLHRFPELFQTLRKFSHQPGLLGLVLLDYLQSLRESTVGLFLVRYAPQNQSLLLPPVKNVPDFGGGFDESL